ncbi:bifunctional 4-hydroxy-2-oxoglutarate aldolase/2-dehydro-3-deoxy-phosphogluconate aldolase [Candidatus Dojkabacteria bacterium]|nr:bifunctional 4-hydroxy-2-oxoglutarate aldolase/2-dehydro-3-deoxy-phosphogluconate aldolase [Candidatus Dojkabacteria bacterium]
MDEIYQKILKSRIVAIVRGNMEVEKIIPLAKAVLKGGVDVIEVTCNSPGVMQMIEMLSSEMGSEMLIGAGTVTSVELASNVIKAGARFVVAPDTNPDVVKFALENNIAVAPGAMTPTEILNVKRLGAKMVKVFPAGVLGPKYIKSVRGPINDFDIMATGGINLDNIEEFLNVGCAAFGIGSSLIKKDLVATGNWDALTKLAADYVSRIN